MQIKKSNGGSASWSWTTNCRRLRNGDEPSRSRRTQPQDGGDRIRRPESELERVKAERAAYLDRAARIQAEFENFRKRSARAQQEYREYALADAIKTLLPILDSLDSALKTKAASLEDFHSGIELIDKQFHDALAKLGVEPVPAQARRSIPISIRPCRWLTPMKSKTTT